MTTHSRIGSIIWSLFEGPVDIDEASTASATTVCTANAIGFKASNGKRKAGRQVKYQADEDEEDNESSSRGTFSLQICMI